MKEHSEQRVVQVLNHLEMALPVDQYHIDGLLVWPYIRLSLKNKLDSHFLSAVRNASAKERYEAWGRLKALCGMFYRFLGHFPFRALLKSRTIQVLMFGHNAPHLYDGARNINRNLVGIAEGLEAKNCPYEIWEYRALTNTQDKTQAPGADISYLPALVNEWCRLLIALKVGQNKEYAFVEDINAELAQLHVPVRLESYKLRHEVRRIRILADMLQLLLQKFKVRKVINLCYYGVLGMAVNLACKRQGIPSIEYQHGVQTAYHPMYARWCRLPARGYELLPSDFWVWGEHTRNVIGQWCDSNTAHQVRIVGNAWLKYFETGLTPHSSTAPFSRYSDDSRIYILVSLQAFPEQYCDFVTEAIKASPNTWCWIVREHPRALLSPAQKQTHFGMLTVQGKVCFESAVSLYALLSTVNIAAHLTAFSTVAFECEYFGIPTVFFHPNGIEGNADIIAANWQFQAANDAKALLEKIQGFVGRKVTAPVYMSKDVTVVESLLDEECQGHGQ